MKPISSIVLFVFAISLFSCGPKRPSAEQVDQFMENLSLRLNMSKEHYMRFVNTLPQEQNVVAGSMAQTVLDFSTKGLKEERRLIDQYEPFKSDEDTKAKSEALKQAAIAIIDTYIDGSSKEMQEVVSAIKKGKVASSPEVGKQLGEFESRLNTTYDAYDKIQTELAKAYNITLY